MQKRVGVVIKLMEVSFMLILGIAENKGIPHQGLINLYLRNCATEHRELHTKWA